MIDVDCITFEQSGVIRELSFQYSFWVAQIDESSFVRLEFDEITLMRENVDPPSRLLKSVNVQEFTIFCLFTKHRFKMVQKC